MKIRFCVLFLCLIAVYARAQKKSCCKPPSILLIENIEAVPLNGIGKFDYPLASTIDSVAFYVNQGYALSFNYNNMEAYMAFVKAAKLDTNSLAAMLGIMHCSEQEDSYSDTYDWASEHANYIRANELPKTDFEEFHARIIIDVNTAKRKQIDTLLENNLERMRKYYPNNAASWAFSIAYYDDNYDYLNEPMPSTEEALDMCNEINGRFKDVAAIQHIKIHLFEDYMPEMVYDLTSIDELAPNSGHIAHMPGHIYYYNGEYAMASQAFKNSFAVDSANIVERPYLKTINWNIVHNAHFWALSLVEEGRYKEAQQKAKDVEKLMYQLDPEYMKGITVALSSLVQVPWRLERWDECITQCDNILDNHVGDMPLEEYYFKGMKLYFEGMQLYYADKVDSLGIKLKELKKHKKSYKDFAKKTGDRDLYKIFARYSTDHESQLDAFYRMLRFAYETFDGIDEASAETEIDYIRFLVHICSQGDPHALGQTLDEFFARVWEHNKNYFKAAEYYTRALDVRPNSAYILLQLARMEHKQQKKEDSMQSLHDFTEQWLNADKDLIEFEKARVLQLDLTK